MRKRVNTNDDAVLIDRETFYKYVSCGRQSADMLAKEAGAERRIGRRIFIYKPAIDRFLESGADLDTK